MSSTKTVICSNVTLVKWENIDEILTPWNIYVYQFDAKVPSAVCRFKAINNWLYTYDIGGKHSYSTVNAVVAKSSIATKARLLSAVQ